MVAHKAASQLRVMATSSAMCEAYANHITILSPMRTSACAQGAYPREGGPGQARHAAPLLPLLDGGEDSGGSGANTPVGVHHHTHHRARSAGSSMHGSAASHSGRCWPAAACWDWAPIAP